MDSPGKKRPPSWVLIAVLSVFAVGLIGYIYLSPQGSGRADYDSGYTDRVAELRARALVVTVGRGSVSRLMIRIPLSVTNTTGEFQKIISGECLFYDREGRLLAQGSAIWMDVQPGQTAGYTLAIDRIDVARHACSAWIP